jgi:hypothetical protein
LWNGATAGTYSLAAVATDDQGATSTSIPVTITVAAPNVPPNVSITGPAAGATFTALASVTVTAAATDTDGSIASIAFFANGAPLGADATSPYAIAWTNVQAGAYTLTAVATDNQGATTTSAAVPITVNQPPGRKNMALAANGAVATASSTLNGNYPASGAIDGDHKGLLWGAGGAWNDGTPYAAPDWLEVAFDGLKAIDEVGVFSMQDNYASPIEPTPTMTFTSWGLRAFEVQYWTGSAWAAVPGGAVTNNTLVWRRFAFAPVTTSRIRVVVTGAMNGYSRIMEVEAFGVSPGINAPPEVTMTSPVAGAVFTAPATVMLTAAASDADGAIVSVEFFANGAPIGSVAASPYSLSWGAVAAGSYSLTAVATDDDGATATSAAVLVTVGQPGVRMNVALASNGGVATASSTLTANYPASAVINGDRRGVGWGAGGGWNDGTSNAVPDWIEVSFAGAKTLDEINVFSMQDVYWAPAEPTPAMTFAYFGLRAFEVQYWDGSDWVAIPGGAVADNGLVWRQFTFAPITTTKIRVLITGVLNGYSRAIEVEAWGNQSP